MGKRTYDSPHITLLIIAVTPILYVKIMRTSLLATSPILKQTIDTEGDTPLPIGPILGGGASAQRKAFPQRQSIHIKPLISPRNLSLRISEHLHIIQNFQ